MASNVSAPSGFPGVRLAGPFGAKRREQIVGFATEPLDSLFDKPLAEFARCLCGIRPRRKPGLHPAVLPLEPRDVDEVRAECPEDARLIFSGMTAARRRLGRGCRFLSRPDPQRAVAGEDLRDPAQVLAVRGVSRERDGGLEAPAATARR